MTRSRMQLSTLCLLILSGLSWGQAPVSITTQPAAPPSTASPVSAPVPGQTPATLPAAHHGAASSMPLLENSALRHRTVLTYSRARFATVSSYSDARKPNLVTAPSITLSYPTTHLRLYELDLFSSDYGSSRRIATTSGLLPSAPVLLNQAFPTLPGQQPVSDGPQLRSPKR
jgi:hypothetical protein